MKTKEKKPTEQAKKAAAVSAVALLTAAGVAAGSLFDTPAALLADGGAIEAVSPADDAADGSDAAETESGETRRRSGIRAALRARMLRLPLAVRALAVLPLWALGSAVLAAAGAVLPLLSPLLGRLAGFALLAALLVGAFALAAKAAFPDLPLKKLLSRRVLAGLLLCAAALGAADALLPLVWDDYGQMRDAVVSAGFFLALCGAFALLARRARKRRAPQKPAELLFTDGVDTFAVRLPDTGGSAAAM